LRPYRERPCCRRAAEQSDELAPSHVSPVRTTARAMPKAYRFATGRRVRSGTQPASNVYQARCPLWVISGHSAMRERCPLYPRKRILISGSGMSALCQWRTLCAPFSYAGNCYSLNVDRIARNVPKSACTPHRCHRQALNNFSDRADLHGAIGSARINICMLRWKLNALSVRSVRVAVAATTDGGP
jgi:hypothetical protein